jgi:hypothetical protein
MGPLEINISYLLVTFLNVGLIIGWPVMSLIGLFMLRRRILPPTTKAIWALIVTGIPILGFISFIIIQPQGNASSNAN